MNISSRTKLVKVKDHSAADTSAVTSDAIDTQGYRGCRIFSSFGTAAANNTMKVQQSSDDGVDDAYADLKDTSVASGASDEDVWVDVYLPKERYLKAVFARGTSSTLESVWAELYEPTGMQPVSNNVSGTIVGELHVSPAEGTA